MCNRPAIVFRILVVACHLPVFSQAAEQLADSLWEKLISKYNDDGNTSILYYHALQYAASNNLPSIPSVCEHNTRKHQTTTRKEPYTSLAIKQLLTSWCLRQVTGIGDAEREWVTLHRDLKYLLSSDALKRKIEYRNPWNPSNMRL